MITITVKVRRGGGQDRFGDAKPYQFHDVAGCIKFPRLQGSSNASSENRTDFTQQVVSGYQLHIPADADVLNTDEMLLPGEDEDGPWWQVEGDVLPWGPSPFTGRTPGAMISLVRRRG